MTWKSKVAVAGGCTVLLLAAVAAGGARLGADRAVAEAGHGLVVTPDAGARVPAHPLVVSVRVGTRAKLFRARLNGESVGRYFRSARHGIRRLRVSPAYGLRFGQNRLRVRVRHGGGKIRSQRMRFRVERNDPLASAGLDRRGVAGRRIHLSGGHSESNLRGEGSKLSYRWNLERVPRGSHGKTILRRRGSPRPLFEARTAGTYRIRLTVTAADGSTGSDAVELDIVPKTPTPAEPPHLAAVADALNTRNPGTEGKIWGISDTNTLPSDWLLQTPDCWGPSGCGPGPLPPSAAPMLSRITQMISKAKESVDFAGLWPPPDGAFRQAIVDGLKAAIAAGHTPTLRVMLGTPPLQYDESTFKKWFNGLIADVGGNLPVQAAAMSTYRQYIPPAATSWNHEKVIDVDGRSAIVGGMNYWAGDYLQVTDPANDVSMSVDGPAAGDVSKFDNVLWGWICDNRSQSLYVALKRSNVSGCVSTAKTLDPDTSGNVPILTVGRLGNGIDVPGESGRESPPIPNPPVKGSACHTFQRQVSDTNSSREYEYRNPGETALRALIASAKKSVFLSQQDMLGCVYNVEAYFDERVFAALGDKIGQRVPVTIVLSDDGAKVGGDSYSNGYKIKDVAQTLTKVVAAEQNSSPAEARKMVCNDVSLAGIRTLDANAWPNGNPFANHAKVVSVDNAAFYIGSENLYPARLQELGMIVEDPTASATLKQDYLDPLWKTAASRALIDPSKGICGQF